MTDEVKKEDENSPEIKGIFKEMFSRVGVEYTDDMVRKPGWFREHSWTRKEVYDFKKWLKKYMKENMKGLFGRKVTNKYIDATINYFMLNYSWKTKEG